MPKIKALEKHPGGVGDTFSEPGSSATLGQDRMTNSTPRQIAIVGLGAWGTALALHCARLGHSVIAWSRDEGYVKNATNSNAITIKGEHIALPSTLSLTSSLDDLSSAHFTIVALPARAWSDVIPRLKASAIVSATKGVEKTTSTTPLSYAHNSAGIPKEKLAVISGPSFASDLTAGHPLSVVAGSVSEDLATMVATALSSSTFRVYTSTDPLGVELGGILKNIIAIIAGVSDSLGYGPSARAAVISRGLYEMTAIATALGAQARTLSGLSGLGDLVMTATEDQSRNRAVGLRLGKGEKLADVVTSLGATAEGVSSAPLVLEVATKRGVPAPLTEQVVKLMRGELQASEVAKNLMNRPLRSEF